MGTIKTYYTVLIGKTDEQAILIVREHISSITAAGGSIEVSFGMGNQYPRILINLPENVSPESLIPDLTFSPVEEDTDASA